MSRYCLDTSAYSHFRRGDTAVVELVARARWIGVSSIVLGELRCGFLMGRDRERNERRLGEFLDEPLVEVQVVDDEAATVYAEIIAALRKSGTPIPTNDAWIGALSMRDGATLLTYDSDFDKISGLSSVVLPVG